MKDLWRVLSACAGKYDNGSEPVGSYADRTFREMGWDSLTLIDAADRIKEEYGVAIAYRYFDEPRTPRDVFNFICAQKAII
ncbi:acyl carrier protein [Streptomyces sp. NPDC053431]|uniref:acyl carrier protein n=1 Tax=Streptomyces sp. NPDC053431 TaxID=3365703 RepID=UPI0037D1BFE1